MDENISLFELFQDSFKELENSKRITELTIKKIQLQFIVRPGIIFPVNLGISGDPCRNLCPV